MQHCLGEAIREIDTLTKHEASLGRLGVWQPDALSQHRCDLLVPETVPKQALIVELGLKWLESQRFRRFVDLVYVSDNDAHIINLTPHLSVHHSLVYYLENVAVGVELRYFCAQAVIQCFQWIFSLEVSLLIVHQHLVHDEDILQDLEHLGFLFDSHQVIENGRLFHTEVVGD